MGKRRRTRLCIIPSLFCLASCTETSFTGWVLSARSQESAVSNIDAWWQIVNGGSALPQSQSPPTSSVRSQVSDTRSPGLLGVVNRIRRPVLKDHKIDHRPKKKSLHRCGKSGGKAKLSPAVPSDCQQQGKAKVKGVKGKGKGSKNVYETQPPKNIYETQLPPYQYDGRMPGLFTAGKGKRPTSSSSSSHKSKRISIYSQPTMGPSPYPSTRIEVATEEPSASIAPSVRPTTLPSLEPTFTPSTLPTTGPTLQPTTTPSAIPSIEPTVKPSTSPSKDPTPFPSSSPSIRPTVTASETPTMIPSLTPTLSMVPTVAPYARPSVLPSMAPFATPSVSPTSTPRPTASLAPSMAPSVTGDTLGVKATPFILDFLTDASLPDTIDPTAALQVTMEYLESYLSFQLSFNQDAVLVDIVTTMPQEGQVQNPNLYVTPASVELKFDRDGKLPGTADVDVLLFTAFSPPFVEQLLAALESLGDGQFSTTNNVIYTPTG